MPSRPIVRETGGEDFFGWFTCSIWIRKWRNWWDERMQNTSACEKKINKLWSSLMERGRAPHYYCYLDGFHRHACTWNILIRYYYLNSFLPMWNVLHLSFHSFDEIISYLIDSNLWNNVSIRDINLKYSGCHEKSRMERAWKAVNERTAC